jgi:NDP-hexose 2,3-enoyl reductase
VVCCDIVPHAVGSSAPLGRTGLEVSRVGIGTVNFGGRVDEAEAHALLDHALERGVTLVDTADIYGWRVYKGWTEEAIGRWLAAAPGRRDEVVVATKVGRSMDSAAAGDACLSARYVVAACEASLRRLRCESIDLYQMHCPDRAVGWDEVWEGMETLVRQGKVRHVGSSNFAGWDLAAAQEAARRRRLPGLASEQCVYNLVTRYAELEILPAAAAYGVGVIAWSPLHGGLLGGVLRKLATGTAVKSAQGRAAAALREQHGRIAAYEALCADAGRDPAELALAWVASRPGVDAVLAGPRTPEQLDAAVAAVEAPPTDDELAALDELFPPLGRGGPAPEAWIE